MSYSYLAASFCVILSCLVLGTTGAEFPPGVLATGTQGPTNPPRPTLGTPINQTSMARLLSVNSIEDFCLFGPPEPQVIGSSETFEVAWCTKPRNNARLIPDGTLTGVSFLKTDFYVQLIGYGNFTRLNIPDGDYGGELDPHGAYGSGNPIGGNVTSDITGSNQNFAEWMLYISSAQFCIRVCINANSTYSTADMCWHELDEMGCQFVMPGNYNFNGTFESCDADVAYPPGWYPKSSLNGTPVFSTFAQRYTGTLSNGGVYTVGDTKTPASPYFTPSSSNCVTRTSISNGVPLTSLGFAAAATSTRGGSARSTAGSASGGSSNSVGNQRSGTRSRKIPEAREYTIVFLASFLSSIAAVALFH